MQHPTKNYFRLERGQRDRKFESIQLFALVKNAVSLIINERAKGVLRSCNDFLMIQSCTSLCYHNAVIVFILFYIDESFQVSSASTVVRDTDVSNGPINVSKRKLNILLIFGEIKIGFHYIRDVRTTNKRL